MKESTTLNEFMFDPLNLDFDLKEELINHSTTISKRIKYTGSGSNNNTKHPDKSFLSTVEDLVDHSTDITLNYTCHPLIGLSLAGEFGENARECFHKICKINKRYDTETCNKEYSICLKNNSEIVSMELLHILSVFSWCEKLSTLIKEKSKDKKRKATIK